MNTQFHTLYNNALALLRGLTTEKGILASAVAADNYKRIWARDAIISGIAGLLADDEIVITGLKNSLLTLATHQHELGMIPSNISSGNTTDVSYGSLVGRIDAHTWFIIGACLYYKNTKDEETWKTLQPVIQKCRIYLKTIEFNAKGWLYTPLSGNWADEYPVHGYTLYDNMLRIWGESLWNEIQATPDEVLQHLKERTYINFWPGENMWKQYRYQESSFNEALKKPVPYFSAFILPGTYDTRFDAAGNALALLNFRITADQSTAILNFLASLKKHSSKKVIPAFWPVIRKGDRDWELLQNNYAFSFKNKPYYFHNGGVWPVWTGLFCLGLANNGCASAIKEIVNDFTTIVSESETWDFQEYFTGNTLQPEGKTQMGFTASGIVFMHAALQNTTLKQKLGL